MYESGYMDHYSDFETYQSNLVSDPDPSSVIESEEDTTEEGSSDVAAEEASEETEGDGDDSGSETGGIDKDTEFSTGSSGSDNDMDHSGNDTGDDSRGTDDQVDTEEEGTSEGSHAGSGDSGEQSEESESDTELSEEESTEESGSDGSYRITIEGDPEEVDELIRLLNGEEKDNDESIDTDNESDGSELGNDPGEISGESSPLLRSDGSGSYDSSGSDGSVIQNERDGADPESIEFYNRNLEALGIIAGCLFFIVFVILCKAIYRFFRLFI